MKSATAILYEHGINIMELDDDFNTNLLNAMERYAEQKLSTNKDADFKFILQKCYIQLFFNLRKEGDFVNDSLLNEIEKILGFVPYAEDESNGKYCPKCDKCFLLKNFDTHHCFKYFEGN